MKHWALDLIGKPWREGACGPDAFNCWGLVQHVFLERLGIEMPQVDVTQADTPENAAAIRRASEVSGWRPSGDAAPKEDDIVLMMSPTGRHVGVMVRANGRLGLLHSLEGVGVCFQRLEDLPAHGFCRVEFWRRAC